MSVSELLDVLKGLDIRLEAYGGSLRCEAPKGVLTDELRHAVRVHKAELLEALRTSSIRPRAVFTGTSEVLKLKRKVLPSPLRMQYAYDWLRSFDMEDRRGRCSPPSSCDFLIDWLDLLPDSESYRRELKQSGDLCWRDWNFLCTLLGQEYDD